MSNHSFELTEQNKANLKIIKLKGVYLAYLVCQIALILAQGRGMNSWRGYQIETKPQKIEGNVSIIIFNN